MKNRFAALAAAALAAALALTSCTAPDEQPAAGETAASTTTFGAETDAFLADHGLGGLDVAEIIEELDTTALADRSTELMASIRPDELVLVDAAEQQVVLPMPEDRFYLSFAPYVSQTHDCYFHSLTTCTGELQDVDVQVSVTDNRTGETVVDEAATTYANGFLGLWLPRDLDATLTVEAEGLSASTPISTADAEDPTCLTTLQLA